jgi:hypothetical protein
MSIRYPRISDNDRDEITATLDGKELRGWSYENDAERRVKMRAAHEFAEGWFQCSMHMKQALKPDRVLGMIGEFDE